MMEEERAGEQMRPLLTTVTGGAVRWGAHKGAATGQRCPAFCAGAVPPPSCWGTGSTAGSLPRLPSPRRRDPRGRGSRPRSPGVPACRPRARGRAPPRHPRGAAAGPEPFVRPRAPCAPAAAAAPSTPPFLCESPAGLVPAAVGGAAAPGLAFLPAPLADEFLGEGEVRTHGKRRASPCPRVARRRGRLGWWARFTGGFLVLGSGSVGEGEMDETTELGFISLSGRVAQ